MPAPTFDYEQIEIDYTSPVTRDVVRKFLIRLARSSAKLIRLDAIAYTTFEVGTNCFFLEPQIRELLDWLSDLTTTFDTDVLPEVHEHYSYPLKLAEKGYWSYDFARPLLVLNTRYHHTNQKLSEWLRIFPRKKITTLDTHDGIGIVDARDLLDPEDIDRTIEGLYQKGSNVKRIYSGPEYQNLDIYQVNCAYVNNPSAEPVALGYLPTRRGQPP